MHNRGAIKRKTVDILLRKKAGEFVTLAEDRVYKQRNPPLSEDEEDSNAHLPAICVFMLTEDAEEIDITQDRRTSDLNIECFTTGIDADDQMDLITSQVERELRHDDTLEGQVECIKYKKTECAYDPDKKSLIQGARVTFEVRYVTDNTSTLPLDDFEEVNAAIDFGGHEITSEIHI